LPRLRPRRWSSLSRWLLHAADLARCAGTAVFNGRGRWLSNAAYYFRFSGVGGMSKITWVEVSINRPGPDRKSCGPQGSVREEEAMTKFRVGLTFGLLLLGAVLSRAGEDAPMPPPPPEAVVCPSGGGIAPLYGPHLHRLVEWVTYRPLQPSCGRWCWQGNVVDTVHAHQADKAAHCAGGSCGCGGCTPCCTPLYQYFLDRCDPTLGFRIPPPPPPLVPPAAPAPAP
jgi:hypothetical protein